MSTPPYLKFIFAFIILGLLISANTIEQELLNQIFNRKAHIIIFDILYFIQSTILFFFFYKITDKKATIMLFLTFAAIQIYFLIKHLNSKTNFDIYVFSTPVFIPLSILYFRDLLKKAPIQKLTQSFVFWVVIGVFFWSCVSFPIYSLYPFIKSIPKYKNISMEIFSISNMALIVMYFFFIKSFLCLKHPQNTP